MVGLAAEAGRRCVELGPSAPLEELALEWRAALGKPVQRGVAVSTAQSEERTEEAIGRELRERLVAPCLAALGDATPRRLHVVLDDFLHLVPIDALPWKDERRLGDAQAVGVARGNGVAFQRLPVPEEPTLESRRGL